MSQSKLIPVVGGRKHLRNKRNSLSEESDDFLCDVCGKYLCSKYYLKQHKLLHERHDDTNSEIFKKNFHYECECGWCFFDCKLLQNHQIQSMHGRFRKIENGGDASIVLQETNTNSSELLTHQNEARQNKYKAISKRRTAKLRMMNENEQITHQCTECDRKFTSNAILQHHIKVHKRTCDCGRKFKTIRSYKFHERRCYLNDTRSESNDLPQNDDENSTEVVNSNENTGIPINSSSKREKNAPANANKKQISMKSHINVIPIRIK